MEKCQVVAMSNINLMKRHHAKLSSSSHSAQASSVKAAGRRSLVVRKCRADELSTSKLLSGQENTKNRPVANDRILI